ncbi:hypothetical protein ACSS31_26835 [Priestia megaterium]
MVHIPIDEDSAKQVADECGGHIVMKNATFNDYMSRGERWSNFINSQKKTYGESISLIE